MKVLIVDDHQIVRDGISVLLMKTADIQIVGEASDGEASLSLLKNVQADVVIADISMPKLNGIELTKIIKKEFPATEVIIFSSHSEGENVVNALEAGAKGILPKNTMREELIEAIRAVYEGKEFISKYIPISTFTNHIKKEKELSEMNDKIRVKLTEREIEILKLIVEGKSNKEISELLFISQRTAEKHKSNILNKLDMNSVVDLVKFAIKNKLIEI
jgi:DNA-binding NarL/FixJ family response regulator